MRNKNEIGSSRRVGGRGKPMGEAEIRERVILNKYEASIDEQIELRGAFFFFFLEKERAR